MRGMPFCSDMRRRSEFTNNVTRRYVVQSGKRARTSVTRFWWRRQRCTGKEKSVSQIHPRALDRAEWEKQGRHTRAQLQCHLAYRSPSWERNHTGWRRRKRGTASCLYNWMSSTRCRRRTTRWNGQRQHKLGQKRGRKRRRTHWRNSTSNSPAHPGGSRTPACRVPPGCVRLRGRGWSCSSVGWWHNLTAWWNNEGSRRKSFLRVRANGLYDEVWPRRATPYSWIWRRGVNQQNTVVNVLSCGCRHRHFSGKYIKLSWGRGIRCWMTSVCNLSFGSCRLQHGGPEVVVYGSGWQLCWEVSRALQDGRVAV